MIVFRLCKQDEISRILRQKHFFNVGSEFMLAPQNNTHKYTLNKNYMHFFEDEISLLYLSPNQYEYICVYDIPRSILNRSKGNGFYRDFINLKTSHSVIEYAVLSEKMKFRFLKKVYVVKESLDFDYYPSKEEIYNNLDVVYKKQLLILSKDSR